MSDLQGSSGNDIITGTNNNDIIEPGWGDDVVDGGDGNDVLVVDYSELPTRGVAWRDVDENGNYDVFIGNAYGVGTPVVIDLGDEASASYEARLSADGATVVYDTNNIYDTSTNEGGLWIKKVDTSESEIKIGEDSAYSPSISANGSKIAYINYNNSVGENEIFVVNSDGTGTPTKIDSGSVSEPRISGDSKKVAWSGVVKYDDTNLGEVTDNEIFVANSDGTEIQQITNTASSHRTNGIGDRFHASDRHPSLSADGSKVAWQSSVGSNPAPPNWYNTIFVGNTDGTNTQTISSLTQEDARQPLLSADGSKVAWNSTDFSQSFVHFVDGSLGGSFSEVRVGNTNGSEVVGIPATLNNGEMTAFSPDGEALAIVQNLNSDDGTKGLFVANADGSGEATLIDEATVYSYGGSWDYGSSGGDGPSLSSYVDIGVRYRSVNPTTGSGEIATWGPSWINYSNIERFNLTGTIYGDRLYGGDLNDTLVGTAGADTLEAGGGGDRYQLDHTQAAGSQIQDSGGTDTLELETSSGVSAVLSASTLTAGEMGLERQDTTLIIDLNQDGIANTEDDLSVLDFFATSGNQAGTGFIETVGHLSGNEILNLNFADSPPSTPTYTSSPFTVNGVYEPISGDFNGDTYGDILWYKPGTDTDYIWSFNSDATYDSNPFTVNGEYTPVVGDFDGSGTTDILWYKPGTGTDYIWSFNSDGTYESDPFTVNGEYEAIEGDFDGSGTTDILWYKAGTGADFIWSFNSDGTYDSEPFTVNGDYDPITGDFDGSGTTDILWYKAGTGADYIWSFESDGSYDSEPFIVNGEYEPIEGDFNGNGIDDILWYKAGMGADYIWSFNADGTYDSEPFTVNGAYEPVAGDFDGNNYTDILWYQAGTGADYIWSFGLG